LFAKYQVPLSGYVLNRVIPKEVAESPNAPDYLRNRYRMQRKYIQEIYARFGDEVLAEVPELERDITGLEMIGRIADLLFGKESLS